MALPNRHRDSSNRHKRTGRHVGICPSLRRRGGPRTSRRPGGRVESRICFCTELSLTRLLMRKKRAGSTNDHRPLREIHARIVLTGGIKTILFAKVRILPKSRDFFELLGNVNIDVLPVTKYRRVSRFSRKNPVKIATLFATWRAPVGGRLLLGFGRSASKIFGFRDIQRLLALRMSMLTRPTTRTTGKIGVIVRSSCQL